MSRQLVDHSPDLKRLQDEGYDIEISNSNYLLVKVPYVTACKQVARGTLTGVRLGLEPRDLLIRRGPARAALPITVT